LLFSFLPLLYSFLQKMDHSLLGHAWQAVAQVSSSDTMGTMHHASNMTDLEVKRVLRMNTYEDNEVVFEDGRGYV
jgi:soluble P-type ATPase